VRALSLRPPPQPPQPHRSPGKVYFLHRLANKSLMWAPGQSFPPAPSRRPAAASNGAPPVTFAAPLLRNQTARPAWPNAHRRGAYQELSWRPPPVHTHSTQHARSACTHAAALQTHTGSRVRPTAHHLVTFDSYHRPKVSISTCSMPPAQ
jgi:hypothetical protein